MGGIGQEVGDGVDRGMRKNQQREIRGRRGKVRKIALAGVSRELQAQVG